MKTVLTNGCFDLLHPGHVRFLREARKLGDCLVVLMNKDRSVRQLKGPNRPIFDHDTRQEMLMSLKSVDYCMKWDGTHFGEFLEDFDVDVYVKGGDYTEDNMDPEELQALKDHNVEIQFIPTYKDYSTTAICQKLQLSEMQ